MKYFTKEWYALMQTLDYTSGLKKIPDKVYTDDEIKVFFDHDLAAEIRHDRKLYNTAPETGIYEDLLDPDAFQPEFFLFVNEETGDAFHPATADEAQQYMEAEFKAREEAFLNRPPFDPTETAECFEECYKNMLRYGGDQYPAWVRDTVDMRLIALNRMPASAYDRLKAEEKKNRRAFDRIMKNAENALSAEDIPERIREPLNFHDACLLRLKKCGKSLEMTLRKDGGWPTGTPYIKIIFKNVSRIEREKGFTLRITPDEEGVFRSSCIYLYDEIYKTDMDFELHLLLSAPSGLRYLTIRAEDILFEDNIPFDLDGQ